MGNMVFKHQQNTKHAIKPILAKIILAAFVFLTLSFKVQAAEVLDDSQSPRKQFNFKFEWANKGDLSALSKDEFFLLKAHLPNVEVRLNTSNYMSKRARIYLALPQQIDGFNCSNGFSLKWKTTGLFAPGTTLLGTRALIYEGLIKSPLMIEIFTFTLKVDANCLIGKLRYAPIYEIELY